jgi:hypothetical protein
LKACNTLQISLNKLIYNNFYTWIAAWGKIQKKLQQDADNPATFFIIGQEKGTWVVTEFDKWLRKLKDLGAKAKILFRIQKIEMDELR